MRITEAQLRKLIREEIEKASLDEMGIPLGGIFGWRKKKEDDKKAAPPAVDSSSKRKVSVQDKVKQINSIILDLGQTEPKLVKDLGPISRYLNSLVKEI
jgi:hypothetical protein